MSRIMYSKFGLLLFALLPFAMLANPAAAQNASVEKFVPAGWETEDKVQGDVTGGALNDLVLVLKKKGDPDASGMLLVLMRKSGDSFEKIGSNEGLLLCENCLGMAGDRKISINEKGVLLVDQLAGSRETSRGI